MTNIEGRYVCPVLGSVNVFPTVRFSAGTRGMSGTSEGRRVERARRSVSCSSSSTPAPVLSSVSLVLEDGAVVRSISEEAVQPLGNRSEGYSLYVPDDGSEAIISANSTLGLLRGLTSFEQLWYVLDDVTYTNLAPVTIENDAPAYVRAILLALPDANPP